MHIKMLLISMCAATAVFAMPATELSDRQLTESNEAIIVAQRAILEARWAAEDTALAAGVLKDGCSATLETCNALEARDESRLDPRAWNSPNALQFYRRLPKWIPHDQPQYPWTAVIRRDSCDEAVCSREVKLEGWSISSTLCDKVFTGCRVPGARWHLYISKVGDTGCWPLSEVIGGSDVDFPSHKFYGAFHDNANGRVIGPCWVEKNHRFTQGCGIDVFDTIVLNSGVRCEWIG